MAPNKTSWKPGQSGNDQLKFQKGVSGNPKGRPKGKNLHTLLAELLEKATPGEIRSSKFVQEFLLQNNPNSKKKVTNAQALVAKLLAKALVSGDMRAIKEILDRIGGSTNPSGDVHVTVQVTSEARATTVLNEIDKLGNNEETTS